MAKMDRKLIAGKQPHEVKYVARKAKVSASKVRSTVKAVGHSRRKVVAALKSK